MLQHHCWQSVQEREVCEKEDDTQKENVIVIKKKVSNWDI